ncbi:MULTISPECIES: glycosyl hydrolase family 17 protein [Maribacter]|uniref:Endo-1,3-beta-glucanase btgC n=1 Tax=Maribacter flavus TaxID=1658664 RepID=A0A5B2TW92_9FLAO|nr:MULTISPECIES: glycosyl hydrolase family 17 protein [Maribacter]KAA2218664.1 glycosyl hydrolase family 17 [Maribacter flavus]MDC6404662.1 glycosyl hydrolase family 17 protein [Maribacter sp. PR66]MEE1972076.1 glycosyl hydrolase family 17 protein [Maribacter flavus]
MKLKRNIIGILSILLLVSCKEKANENPPYQQKQEQQVTARDILGNPEYQAISYGGYRKNSRQLQPTMDQLKEDMRLLNAMGIRVLRTYNVQLPHASNVLKAIRELKNEDETFEMYVMLGAWIDCKNAWTGKPVDHNIESEQNADEIKRAVALANDYQDIVKVIAVGNEAMVKWAESYYVQPEIILKWVNHLQALKSEGKLPSDLWITSSDNFASWGGGGPEYHVKDLDELIKAVDYLSVHTYPMHDTHYNPQFWGITNDEASLSQTEQINAAMQRALDYAKSQYNSVVRYMKNLGVDKPVHIGETGWASHSDGLYGPEGSKACDEYKSAIYYQLMRNWTQAEGISCFYFEAFDEPWKDAQNPNGSENHFGLFTVDGNAKYALWNLVDEGILEGMVRDGNTISKTYSGDLELLLNDVALPSINNEINN